MSLAIGTNTFRAFRNRNYRLPPKSMWIQHGGSPVPN